MEKIEKAIPGTDYIGLACGVLLFNDQGKLLMMLRSKNTRADHNMWGIPGGLVEFNETVEEAIRREAKEETGVELVEVLPIGFVDHILRKESKHFVSRIFVAQSYNGVPANMEPDKFDRFEWFDMGNLPDNTSEVVKNALIQYKDWTKTNK